MRTFEIVIWWDALEIASLQLARADSGDVLTAWSRGSSYHGVDDLDAMVKQVFDAGKDGYRARIIYNAILDVAREER
jgi:hypothetical protein